MERSVRPREVLAAILQPKLMAKRGKRARQRSLELRRFLAASPVISSDAKPLAILLALFAMWGGALASVAIVHWWSMLLLPLAATIVSMWPSLLEVGAEGFRIRWFGKGRVVRYAEVS